MLITNLSTDISYEVLCAEMRDICKFDGEQPFTVKWVDEEGSSLLVSSFVTRAIKTEGFILSHPV